MSEQEKTVPVQTEQRPPSERLRLLADEVAAAESELAGLYPTLGVLREEITSLNEAIGLRDSDLTTCKADLVTERRALRNTIVRLETCHSDLNSVASERDAAQCELTTVRKALVKANLDYVAEMETCQGALTTCQSYLKVSDAESKACAEALLAVDARADKAEAALTTCQADLAACRAEPEPPALFKKFAWRHSNGDNPAQLEAMKKLNAETFNGEQDWRTYSGGFAKPPLAWQTFSAAELRTGDWRIADNSSDMWGWADDEVTFIRSAMWAGRNVEWVLLDAEVSWTERSEYMLQHLRAEMPYLKVYSGPMSWSGPLLPRLAKTDGSLTFANPGSDGGRYKSYMGEDFSLMLARHLGAMEFLNKRFPFSLMPQPVDGSPPYKPVIVGEYRRALEIACSVSPEWDNLGVGMWGAKRLFQHLLDCGEHPVEYNNAALDIIRLYQAAVPIDVSARPRVYIPQQMDGDMPDSRIDKALARIVWHAGGLPVVEFNDKAGPGFLYPLWSVYTPNPADSMCNLSLPAVGRTEKLKQYGYKGEFAVFNDSGSPYRQGLDSHELRCAVRDAEIQMANEQVKPWLEG